MLRFNPQDALISGHVPPSEVDQGEVFGQAANRLMFVKENFTPPIRAMKEDELQLARDVAEVFDGILIEFGCGEGNDTTFVPLAHDLGRPYRGIDLREDAIERAISLHLEQRPECRSCEFHVGPAELLGQYALRAEPHHACALYPFGLFGNLEDPALMVRELARSEIGAVVLTDYRTGPKASNARKEYYEQLHRLVREPLPELRVSRGVHGSRITALSADQEGNFRHQEGLDSFAYRPWYLAMLFRKHGYELVETRSLGEIGKGLVFVHKNARKDVQERLKGAKREQQG